MENTIKLLILLLIFVAMGDGARTKMPTSLDTRRVVDGICKTMIETQGYTCEEHKVSIFNIFYDLLHTNPLYIIV